MRQTYLIWIILVMAMVMREMVERRVVAGYLWLRGNQDIFC